MYTQLYHNWSSGPKKEGPGIHVHIYLWLSNELGAVETVKILGQLFHLDEVSVGAVQPTTNAVGEHTHYQAVVLGVIETADLLELSMHFTSYENIGERERQSTVASSEQNMSDLAKGLFQR